MLSKNNLRNKFQNDSKRVPHYGLRKLSVGLASVLLSTTLYFGLQAQAATKQPAASEPQTGQVAPGTEQNLTANPVTEKQSANDDAAPAQNSESAKPATASASQPVQPATSPQDDQPAAYPHEGEDATLKLIFVDDDNNSQVINDASV